MIGRTVLHYTVTAELGAGAMGRVYLARDERTGRRVALKFLPPEAAGDAAARARLLREATAVARLSHPAIVTLHATEDADGELFLVEEYVEGESLAHRLARGPLGPAELPRLARALAEALAHAHAHGVLHRDLKPANVLITADGSYKVADFGIARVEGEGTLTGTGDVVGTLAYLAPERVSGHRGDARADLFALGAVLYEAMCARRAFLGGSEAEVLHAVMNVEPRPPEVVTASLLPLAGLVMRLLSKDPAQRPPSAEAVLEALAAMQPDAPRVAAGRRGWLTPVAVLLAVAVVAAATWLLRGRLMSTPTGDEAVAVLYFENVADPGDPSRIGSITSNLLIVSLAQASNLDVLSTQRLLDAMRQLGHGAGALDRGAALLVARRAHAGRIVTGSILQVAPNLIMTAEVSDVRSGKVLYAERIAGEPGQTVYQLVDALGARLLGRMARHADAARLAPVAQRTSADLEAQREYLAGMERFAIGDLASADSAFTRAVARDPGFAQALYQLAITRWWGDEPASAIEDIRRAQAGEARLSAGEREFIGALQLLIRRDFAAAVPTFERLAAGSPEDKLVLYGLEEAHFHAGQYQATVEVARRILALDPGFTLAGRHMVDALMRLDRAAEAQRVSEDLLRRDPGSTLLWSSAINSSATRADDASLLRLRDLYRETGSRAAAPALALLAVSEGADADSVCRLLVGAGTGGRALEGGRRAAAYWIALRRGRFREAERIGWLAWREVPASVPWAEGFWAAVQAGDTTAAFAFLDSISIRAEASGVMTSVEYREPGRAMLWLWLGRPNRARAALAREAGHASLGGITAGFWTAVRVGLLEAQGRPAEALDSLPRARWLGFSLMSSQLRLRRARLLARCGRHVEALAVLDSLVRCPAIYPDEAVRLRLERGRSLEALRRPAEAAAAYREFLRIWKDADPGRPEVAEARRALARLGRG